MTNEEIISEGIHVHCFYRSPNSTVELTKEVIDYIKNIPRNFILTTILLISQEFLDTTSKSFPTQLVDFPTNFTPRPMSGETATCASILD